MADPCLKLKIRTRTNFFLTKKYVYIDKEIRCIQHSFEVGLRYFAITFCYDIISVRLAHFNVLTIEPK